MIVKVAIIIQTVLYLQPDAKLANGVYWAKFWMNLATSIVS